MILSATGHRPDKLGGYSKGNLDKLRFFARTQLQRYPNIKCVKTGMALGWDTAIAFACIDLGIGYDAIIPFVGQEKAWSIDSQVQYNYLLSKAESVVTVSEGGYAAYKMFARNKYLVDKLEGKEDFLLALFDGSVSGTKYCVEYAKEQGKIVKNIWDEWIKYSK